MYFKVNINLNTHRHINVWTGTSIDNLDMMLISMDQCIIFPKKKEIIHDLYFKDTDSHKQI